MAFESDNVASSSVRPLSQAGDQFKDLKRLGFVVSSWFGSFVYTILVFHDTSFFLNKLSCQSGVERNV